MACERHKQQILKLRVFVSSVTLQDFGKAAETESFTVILVISTSNWSTEMTIGKNQTKCDSLANHVSGCVFRVLGLAQAWRDVLCCGHQNN